MFFGPEKNLGCSQHYSLPYLRVLEESVCKNILKKIAKCPKNHIFSKTEPYGDFFPARTGFFPDLKKIMDVPGIIVYHF